MWMTRISSTRLLYRQYVSLGSYVYLPFLDVQKSTAPDGLSACLLREVAVEICIAMPFTTSIQCVNSYYRELCHEYEKTVPYSVLQRCVISLTIYQTGGPTYVAMCSGQNFKENCGNAVFRKSSVDSNTLKGLSLRLSKTNVHMSFF